MQVLMQTLIDIKNKIAGKYSEILNKFTDFISEQEWFQELKTKWEELDPQSRGYLQLAAAGASLMGAFAFLFMFMWNVYRLRNELTEKRTLLTTIQAAHDEISRLKDTVPHSGLSTADTSPLSSSDDSNPWTAHFESLASSAGLEKTSISVTGEKNGASSDQSKEVLFDLSLKNVSIKQVIRYMASLETGARPVKVRNLTLDTHPDLTGYLDAHMAVSGFSVVELK
jgi:hypothetical protein